eukprot:10471-Eustigmatos_ZCMA.PRE.1
MHKVSRELYKLGMIVVARPATYDTMRIFPGGGTLGPHEGDLCRTELPRSHCPSGSRAIAEAEACVDTCRRAPSAPGRG